MMVGRRRALATLLGATLLAGAARAAEQAVTAPGPFGPLAGTFKAAAQSVDHLCGLVLIAAPGRALADVLRSQLAGNPHNRPYLQGMLQAIDTLESDGSVDTAAMPLVMQQLFAPAVQGFLRDLFAHDPAALIATVTLPVLIVQGGNDLQVTIEDADILAAANPAAERVDLPAMNHVLKAVPDNDVAANLASYADPAQPPAPGLAAAITEFVLR